MKKLKLLWWCCAALACASVWAGTLDLRKPIPELTLNNGKVLHNVQFISYARSGAMAKWDGGRGTILYEEMPKDVQAATAQFRPGESQPVDRPVAAQASASKPKESRAAKAPVMRTITGQVFVATQGAGSYKFGGVKVSAYKKEEIERARYTVQSCLPTSFKLLAGWQKDQALIAAWNKALADMAAVPSVTETDADGNYSLRIPTDAEYCIFASAFRRAYESEYNLWVVPVGNDDRVDLNQRNTESEN